MTKSTCLLLAGALLMASATPALADPFSLGAIIAASLSGALGGTTFGIATGTTIFGVGLGTAIGGAITVATSRRLTAVERTS